MSRRLPLVDWESLLNKAPFVIRNITHVAAYALVSGETYAGEIADGRRGAEAIKMPNSLLQLGPTQNFSPEILPVFRRWVITAAFRDAVEVVLKHLDDINDILAISSLPLPPDPDTPTWQERIVKGGQAFHRWFLKRKIQHLEQHYGYTVPSDEHVHF